jgi:hypothetical protein
MITFAVMTPLGTLYPTYSPVLNQYTTQITAVVMGSYFIFRLPSLRSSEGHKFNIAKVSMIILGSCWRTFIILACPQGGRAIRYNLLFFFKTK